MKIVTVVGARPQFIKAGPVSRLLRKQHIEVLVHTGQHYDDDMSAIFFDELNIPAPDYDLGIGSGSQGTQTGAMLARIEEVLLCEQPDWVLIYGDTNSTLAGALAATKLHIKVTHVEAGLRSFNRLMPEEINRIVADHVSDLLFCPSITAVNNLANEGITRGVHLVGDVMSDALAYAVERSESRSDILSRLELAPRRYLLATVHRPENTDNLTRLLSILSAFDETEEPIIFPIHPRTRKAVESAGISLQSRNPRFIEPVGHLDMVQLERFARLILTDSGGMQKEAYWLGVPCVTMRDQTEWVETVEAAWNVIVGADKERIMEAVKSFAPSGLRPILYGDGHTAEKMEQILSQT
jgi:UDP-N-acetylglucosamine 2-epimerase